MNKNLLRYSVIVFSIVGLLICVAAFLPFVRQMIIELVEKIAHYTILSRQEWMRALLSYAIGGICLILLFDFCILTKSGKLIVHTIKNEVRDCISEIDFHSLVKPTAIIFGVYVLGAIALIRANFSYLDDLLRNVDGFRGWYCWSRYISEFLSIFIHADTNLTDISPIPQLMSIVILSFSSVLLVYVLCDKKITVVRLLASVPMGLSPYMLECLSFKYDSPYMALSVLASIFPFLFMARKKAFIFCSIISLLCMIMNYQAASGIYILIVIILSFRYWNEKKKTSKEIFLFIIRAMFSYILAMAIFKLFFMKPFATYVSNEMFSFNRLIPGVLANFKIYIGLIYNDFNPIWKILILFILIFFFAKSVQISLQKKIEAFFVTVLLIGLLFVFSYGLYLALANPLFAPRALYGFGVLLAILSIYAVSGYKKIAVIPALALSWCFITFANSYGNALADEMRYVNFRAGILLQDLSTLYPHREKNEMTFQLKNTIGLTPAVQNIAKHNPIIKRFFDYMLEREVGHIYYLIYFNFGTNKLVNLPGFIRNGEPYVDFNMIDLPVVLESYYHIIKSDGNRILVILKE